MKKRIVFLFLFVALLGLAGAVAQSAGAGKGEDVSDDAAFRTSIESIASSDNFKSKQQASRAGGNSGK